MPSYRRCCGLLFVALLVTACLTGCSEGAEFERAYERSSSLEDKCFYATKAADAYARSGSDAAAYQWQITRDLKCAELTVALTS